MDFKYTPPLSFPLTMLWRSGSSRSHLPIKTKSVLVVTTYLLKEDNCLKQNEMWVLQLLLFVASTVYILAFIIWIRFPATTEFWKDWSNIYFVYLVCFKCRVMIKAFVNILTKDVEQSSLAIILQNMLFLIVFCFPLFRYIYFP